MKKFVWGLLMFGTISCFSSENLSFVDCNDPILNQVALPLNVDAILDPKMQSLFDAMLSFAKGEQGDQQRSILVGLAAPQIGKPLRVILVDTKADGKGGVSNLCLYINPEILKTSTESETWYEGCYSTGNVKGVVTRPKEVTIQALNRNGEQIQETHTGYVARIFQHEIDHLNGIRFPDRVPSDEKLHIVKDNEMYKYRNQQSWRHWDVTIPQKDWKEHMQ